MHLQLVLPNLDWVNVELTGNMTSGSRDMRPRVQNPALRLPLLAP
jgi:hypothetical protein